MGILSYFQTLQKHQITKQSIIQNYKRKQEIYNVYLDFNAIIHNSSAKMISMLKTTINNIQEGIISLDYTNITRNKQVQQKLQRFKPENKEQNIKEFLLIVNIVLDQLIIDQVLDDIEEIIQQYCDIPKLKKVYIMMDGVPYKAKMIEQRQRKYSSAILDECRLNLVEKNHDILVKKNQLLQAYPIQWSKNNISTGTVFMSNLSEHLLLWGQQQNYDLSISNHTEQGEGEFKIMNSIRINEYIGKLIMIISPDADLIQQSMLLCTKSNIKILRYDQHRKVYDLLDINKMNDSIYNYIKNHVNIYSQKSNKSEQYIIYDLVFVSNLFGNDFLPKIQTIDIRMNFSVFIHSYIRAFNEINENRDINQYLVIQYDNQYTVNYSFLLTLMRYLEQEESLYLNNSILIEKYMNLQQIMKIFPQQTIKCDIRQLQQEITKFHYKYNTFFGKSYKYKQNKKDIQFFDQLSQILFPEQYIRSVDQLCEYIIDFKKKHKKIPKIMIKLELKEKAFQKYHIIKQKELGIIDREIYQIDQLLGNYGKLMNNKPINFDDDYYKNYVGLGNKQAICQQYIQGLQYVFDLYFNEQKYLQNSYVYPYKRSPLIRDLVIIMQQLGNDDFQKLQIQLKQYKKNNPINTIQHLLYTLPLTQNNIKLLPQNVQISIPYLIKEFPQICVKEKYIKEIADYITQKDKSKKIEIDGYGCKYFSKIHFQLLQSISTKKDQQFFAFTKQFK